MKEGRDLETLTGYQLLKTNMILQAAVREALQPHGVTPAKLAALLLIRENPGCGQTALGRALNINRSSSMKLVNVLTDLGFVERRPGRDLRSNALHLSAAGELKTKEITALARDTETAFLDNLPAEERAIFVPLLKKLRRPKPSSSIRKSA